MSPCVGDQVEISLSGDGTGAIEEIKPRKNQFIRPPVANLDQLVIVASTCEPSPCLLYTSKIHKSRLSKMTGEQPGAVLSQHPFIVCCGDGVSIEVLEVQLEGKKRMAAEDFFRGHPVELSTVLGI